MSRERRRARWAGCYQMVDPPLGLPIHPTQGHSRCQASLLTLTLTRGAQALVTESPLAGSGQMRTMQQEPKALRARVLGGPCRKGR